MSLITPSRFTPAIPPLLTVPSDTTIDQTPVSTPPDSPDSLDNPAALHTAFGDNCNWLTLYRHLQAIAQAMDTLESDPGPRLKNTMLLVCEDSSYYRQHALKATDKVSLDAFMRNNGLSIPQTLAELITLNSQVAKRAQTPPLGNFSGALSWPVPLSQTDQAAINRLLRSSISGLPGLPLADGGTGVLGYLLSGSSVSTADLDISTRAMEKLLGSPKAQALGLAMQAVLGGLPTDTSVNDYLMAAIQLGLDPESTDEPSLNKIAGFDLAQPGHRSVRASVVVDSLSRHLVAKGRATEQTAKLASRLLLARTAPQFLVRDIPESVTYGSLTWTQLAVATARIEADTPGRSLSMSYAEILACAEQLNTSNAGLQEIQQKALTDWGVANGLLPNDTPTEARLESVRIEYNRQLQALASASSLAHTPIPSRREMALAALKAAFPGLDPTLFEAQRLVRVFRIPGRAGKFPGLRSMLDIVMYGEKLGINEHWASSDKRIPADAFCALYKSGKLDVAATFETQYKQAIEATEKGHQGLVQYLLSTLPAQDRKNLEYGELAFFHTNEYTLAMDMFSKPALKTRGHTLRVKTTLGGEVNVYEIDTKRATIEKQNYWITRYTPPHTDKKLHQREANVISKTVLFNPFKDEQPDRAKAQTPNAEPPPFGSARSDYIGRVFAKSLDLHNEDLSRHAKGWTSFDNDDAINQALGEFFLNLIPLRSAIVNFTHGNIADGLFDLSLDLIGLVTLGAGKVAQAGKALSKGIAGLRGAARLARFVGAAAIEAFNPLSGVGDLAAGAVGLFKKGSRRVLAKGLEVVNQLRGASGSYDLLKAVSKQYDGAATGTLKVGGALVDGGAVLHGGKWYAFDASSMRAYGSPLDDFTAHVQAVDGVVGSAYVAPGSELSNNLFRQFNVPETSIGGLSRNSQGVYVAADGHLSHIRHTDRAGQTAVYEVRQVSRGEDGAVQARIYHNNRQTELLVQHVEGDQWQRLGALGGVYINADHLRAWEALSVAEQQKLTIQGFARRHRLNLPTWTHYVQADGRLSAAGVIVRDRPLVTPLNAIKPAHIRDWQGMTQQARDATTLEGFASVRNLDIRDFKVHVMHTGGLSARGEALLFTAAGGTYSTLTDAHLFQWQQLVQQPNNRVTPAAFRRQHNLNPVTWTGYAYVDGTLNEAGLKRVRGTPPGVTVEPPTSQPLPGPSRKRPAPDPVDPPQEVPLDLSTAKSQVSTPGVGGAESFSNIQPIIKIDPDLPPPRSLAPHQVDNALPILQDPSNPKLSLTQSLEGPIDEIRISNWNGLLDGLDPAQKNSVGNRIKASIKDWLRSEGRHGAKFDEALEVITPLDDGGPARGASVWARRDIPQFEVLGPYSGKYHASEASLFEEQRKQGSRAVLTYLFGTRSSSRSVSALNTGNTLSLINTSQLRNGPAWQANNVASISVGKNLTFYVSLKDIKAGDELLVDYGPFYNPVPDIAIKPDPDA